MNVRAQVKVLNWEVYVSLELAHLALNAFETLELDCQDRRRSKVLKGLLESSLIIALLADNLFREFLN